MNSGQITARHYGNGQPIRVEWESGVIQRVEEATESTPDAWIAPGLVDLQINGFAGIDFQQDNLSEKNLLTAIQGLQHAGCTRFLLTLITDQWPKLMARLQHLRALREASPELKRAIAGWHIEGPFLSPEPGFCGAHNPEAMCDPEPSQIEELRAITGKDPVLLTLAPERHGALKVIQVATELRMKISLGHTNASSATLAEATQCGATGFTHLGNGCPNELNRFDNIVWRAFETPGLTMSLIPDQIHVSPALFRIAHRVLGSDSIYYTSDAMSAAGAPPGRYRLASLELEVGADRVVRYPGKPNFAGSALRPIDGVFLAAKMLQADWRLAWHRFSELPAKLLNLPSGLQPGSPADFCLIQTTETDQLQALQVISGGRKVFG